MLFPRFASDASGVSWSWGSCNPRFDHRYLDCLRRSLLLRHHRIKLSSFKKNASHFDKHLISEPMSKPSTGPSIQSLCMKIDSHSRAFFLAVTRIIHRLHFLRGLQARAATPFAGRDIHRTHMTLTRQRLKPARNRLSAWVKNHSGLMRCPGRLTARTWPRPVMMELCKSGMPARASTWLPMPIIRIT